MNSTLFTLMVARDAQAEGRHEIADAMLAEVCDVAWVRQTQQRLLYRPRGFQSAATYASGVRRIQWLRWQDPGVLEVTGTVAYTLADPQYVGARRVIVASHAGMPVGTLTLSDPNAPLVDDETQLEAAAARWSKRERRKHRQRQQRKRGW